MNLNMNRFSVVKLQRVVPDPATSFPSSRSGYDPNYFKLAGIKKNLKHNYHISQELTKHIPVRSQHLLNNLLQQCRHDQAKYIDFRFNYQYLTGENVYQLRMAENVNIENQYKKTILSLFLIRISSILYDTSLQRGMHRIPISGRISNKY